MPRHKKATGLAMSDAEILEAALFGLETKRSEIDEKMAELRRQIGGRDGQPARKSVAVDLAEPTPKKRTMSAAGRRRIAAAQRKRWAALKEGAAEEPKPAQIKKRKLSAAGRKRIIAATRKRWAEYKAKKAAAK
jgi:hypothetical protein